MGKLLLLLALVANTFLLTISADRASSSAVATSSSSSRASASSSAYASSSSSSYEYNDYGDYYCGCNERLVQCPEAVCEPKTCYEIGLPIPCLDLAYNGRCPSPPSCICEEGYVRDARGNCIPMEKCPPTNRCKKNEVYDLCPAPCPLRTCGINDAAVDCVPALSVGDPKCDPPKCRCKDEFYRNDVGDCVKFEDCPKCLKPNEEYDPCIAPCPPRRCDVDDRLIKCAKPPVVGDPSCKGGCRCSDGFYKNAYNVCVTRDECPLPCKDGERYEKCPPFLCQPLHCTEVGFPITCPNQEYGCPSYAACICDKGNVRDSQGKCIPKKQCPSCKGDPNAVAGCGVYCNKRCRDIGKEPGFCITVCFDNACDCKPGFYLDENTGKCVLPKQCTLQCGPNEQYNECINGQCKAQNCSQIGFPIPCRRIDPKFCTKGCICKDGYVRDCHGICIPIDKCPTCGGDENAQPGCGINCNKQCSDIGKEPGACIALCKENACDCKKDFFYDVVKNKCVKPEYCTPTCGVNEEFNECANANCNPQNCTQLGYPIACPRIAAGYCKKGCLCKENYVRNAEGVCIPSKKCPSCRGDINAQSGCGVNCNRRCSDIGKEPGACLLICDLNGCDCKEGYFLDDNTKKCVKPENCSRTCGANEEFNECINANCSPQNCKQIGFPISCTPIEEKKCKKGCLCKSGYVRNYEGICVPSKACPSCGGDPNAVPGCGVNCKRRCSDIGKKIVACPDICILNGCDCKEGYYLNSNISKCVKPEDCGLKCLPENNEVYSDCINGGCEMKNCSQYGKPVPCKKMDPKFCIKGCLCKEGYLRASNGQCVPVNDCPEACNKPHEKYFNCTYNCPPQICESLDKVYACPIKTGDNCKPMCKCEKGYFRNKIGECITEEQCRKCNGTNEYYSCGGACDNVCKNIKKQNQTICLIVNIKCNEMCYCEKDYARALNNTCIPINKCNEPQCPINERYEKCPGRSCEPLTCYQLGKPITCPTQKNNGWCASKPGCVCVDGYVRNYTGKCIPKTECPSCGDDPNAVSGCGVNCGKLCPNNNRNPKVCPKICFPNACDCKEGFAFDNITKKCVKPSDCSGCGGDPNAEPGCGYNCGKRCPIETSTKLCPRIQCQPKSCDCKPGFLFDANLNKCVIPKDCSSICNTLNNEVYDSCVNGRCIKRNCSQLGGPNLCIDPKVCEQGCSCKEGYLRLNNGTCVPIDQCPTPTCKTNEIFEKCPGKVGKPQTCDQVGYPVNSSTNECGLPTCICNSGYARNSEGVCIPTNQCPSCGGDPNAMPGCGYNCGKRCPIETSTRLCPRIQCQPISCDCKPGFLLDANIKKCVRPKDCSPVCDAFNNEVYDSCVNGGCNKRNCSQLADPVICIDPRNCSQGCKCKDGYLRLNNINNTCVPIDICPTPKCKKNERFELCPSKICEPRTCKDVGFPQKCTTSDECTLGPACICNSGYARNSEGVCIPIDQCPTCGGDPNATPGCGFHCPNRCPKAVNPAFCPRIACKPISCDCKEGFLFDNNTKICVKPEDCSPICDGSNNEVFDPCVNGPCGWKNCSQIGGPENCVKVKKCVKGCSCKANYYRLNNGTCVLKDQCPKTSFADLTYSPNY